MEFISFCCTICRMFFKFARFLIRLFMRSIAVIEIHGMENIPSGNIIGAANHLGRLDTAVLFVAINRQDLILPVAEKYKNHWLFGLIGRSVNAIWLNRFEADFSAMREILARLKQGGALAIAPEGTRSKTETLQEAKLGAAYLAGKSGCPVIPVAITGTEDRVILENLKRLRRSKIVVRIGKPFTIQLAAGKGREQALRQATDELMCRIAAMLPENYRGFYANHPYLKTLTQQ